MEKKLISTKIPVEMEYPDERSFSVRNVLDGEYESWYFGNNLTILDIGANVGSFAVWANLRWPNSLINAYEPHPETFKMLVRNVEGLTNIACHDVAVYPSEKNELFYSRYPGDGESGLVTYVCEKFETLHEDNIFEVPVLHPRDLPGCDVVKLDVEGAEGDILRNMDLQGVSVILLEYHNDKNRKSIKELLMRDFSLEYEDSCEYDPNLRCKEDHYSRLFFANKHRNRLRKLDSQFLEYSSGHNIYRISLRQLLQRLPSATKYTLKRKIRIIRNHIQTILKKLHIPL